MAYTARQLACIAAANKIVYWSFQVTDINSTVYDWSTGSFAASGSEYAWDVAHTFKIINFSGVTLRRTKSESGLIAPNDVTFSILNSGSTLTASDFVGGTVRIGEIIQDSVGREMVRSWKFRIKYANPYNQQIDVTCVDFLQEHLDGAYPPTRLISDIFPSSEGSSDNMCVPEIYGTCYIPLRSAYMTDARYYLLGPTGVTYTISRVRSPRDLGSKIEWLSGSYTMQQSTATAGDSTTWRVFQPLIVDGACGLWKDGDGFRDMPTQFSRSDTATTTNPADIIQAVLVNMGVDASDIGTSFAAAHTTFDTWGLEWNLPFYYHQDRATVLANLLNMCHSALVIGETIELVVLSKTSVKTITESGGDVCRVSETGAPNFKSSYVATSTSADYDSGYVAFQEADEAHDLLIKVIVPAKTTKTDPDSACLECIAIQDTQDMQRAGILYHQRRLGKQATESAVLKGTCLTLDPDQVITFSGDDFGGAHDVLIDEITYNPDCSLSIKATKYESAFDDWTDLSPTAVTVIDDATDDDSTYSVVIAGAKDTPGGSNTVPGRLIVGNVTNYIDINSGEPWIQLVTSTGVAVALGNLDNITHALNPSGFGLLAENVFLSGHIEAASGEIGGITIGATYLESTNYVINTSGFRLNADGSIYALEGTIGCLVIDANGLHSSGFQSGNTGINIGKDGTAEFLNCIVRGEMRSAVWVKDEVHVAGGTLLLSTALTLETDVTTPASTGTAFDVVLKNPVSGAAQAFPTSSYVRMRTHNGTTILDAWMSVNSYTNNGDGTATYNMTLRYGSASTAFAAGTTLALYGASAGANILLTSDMSNGPYIDFFTVGSTPWLGTTCKTRLGNLAGITDVDFGGALTGYGLYSDNIYLKGQLVIASGSSGYANLSDVPTELSDINATEGTKLTGIEDGADVTDYTDTRIANALTESNVTTITQPGGGTYSGGISVTGAIVITLPQSWSNTMMRFYVDVFLHSSARASFTLQVTGYNYAATTLWIRASANLIGNTASDNRVRFGHDGTYCCIVIGETTSTWTYPKVAVRNFQAGYSNYTSSLWDDGWSVTVASDLTGYTFTADFSDALIDASASRMTKAALTDTLAAIGTPSAAGLYAGSDYLGLYKDSRWRAFMDASGNFGLLTSSGSYGLRYYGAASGSYGEGDLVIGGATNYEFWDQSAGTLTIVGSGAITGGVAIGTPASGGLFLGSDYMGYHNGSSWTNYIKNDGSFGFIQSEDNVNLDPTAAMLTNSGLDSFSAANLLDDSTASTGFTCDSCAAGSNLIVDLGSGVSRCYGKLRLYMSASSFARTFDIAYSDGGTYTTVKTGWAPTASGWNEISWGNVGFHRYWKVTVQDSAAAGPDIMEMEWYTEGSYITFDNSELKMKLRQIAVTSPEGILVSAGGDVTLTGDTSNPAKLVHKGTSISCSMYVNSTGEECRLEFDTQSPINQNTRLYLGGWSTYRLPYRTYVTAYNYAQMLAGLTGLFPYYGKVYVGHDADAGYAYACLQAVDPSYNHIVSLDSSHHAFYPNRHKAIDLGLNALAWDDCYADDFTNVADFPYFDEIDDLAAIRQIQPLMKDGEYVRDDLTKNVLIDDDTLPKILLHRHKRDSTPSKEKDSDAQEVAYRRGDIARDPDGKPYIPLKAISMLSLGAIKQLDNKYEEGMAAILDRLAAIEKSLGIGKTAPKGGAS